MYDLEKVIQVITDRFHPDSIFLYGSRARNDFLPESDYEVGVIFHDDNYVSRSEIRALIDNPLFSIYPFRRSEILNVTIDTPFQKTLYLWDISSTGKTIWGERMIEELILPEIHILDLLQDVRFSLWCATAAHISLRSGDERTASNLFYRSCLYWARDYLVLQEKLFVSGYENIFKSSKTDSFGEYYTLIGAAYMVRMWSRTIDSSNLFLNIKFLNKFVEARLMEVFESRGNAVVVS